MSNKFAKAAVRITDPNDSESTIVINREDYDEKTHGPIVQEVQNDRGEKNELQTGTVSRGGVANVGERESAKAEKTVAKKKRSKKKRTKKTSKA